MLPWGRKRGSDYEHDEPDDNKNVPPQKRLQDAYCWKKSRQVPLTAIPSWGDVAEKDRKNQVTYERGASCAVSPSLSKKVSLWRGDITTLQIDAIVNAANRSLLGGGGVDGAIHSAAGPELLKECRTLGGCDTGDAKITLGHRLPAKYVLHTVGPTNRSRRRLKSCYLRCLQLALDNNIRSLAFCCIATGIYGYPNEDAAHVALETVREWLEMDGNVAKVDRIIFCVFLEIDHRLYQSLLPLYFPVGSHNGGTCSKTEQDSSFKNSAVDKKQQTEEKSLQSWNVLMPVEDSTGPLATYEGSLPASTSEVPLAASEEPMECLTDNLETTIHTFSEGSRTTSNLLATSSEDTNVIISKGTASYEEGTLSSREAASTAAETKICDKLSVCAADTRSTNSVDQDTTLPGVEDLSADSGRKLDTLNEDAERKVEMHGHNQAISEQCVCTGPAVHKASSSKCRTPENIVELKSSEIQRTTLETPSEGGIEQTPSPSC